jgi:hypothetical protein
MYTKQVNKFFFVICLQKNGNNHRWCVYFGHTFLAFVKKGAINSVGLVNEWSGEEICISDGGVEKMWIKKLLTAPTRENID